MCHRLWDSLCPALCHTVPLCCGQAGDRQAAVKERYAAAACLLFCVLLVRYTARDSLVLLLSQQNSSFFLFFSAKIKTPEGACVLCKRGLRGFFDGCCPASSLLLSVFLYSSVFYFSAQSPARSVRPALPAQRRYRQADPRSRLGPWLGF